MSDRGMKKWVAYKALVEQEDALNKVKNSTKRVQKPIISEERAEEINEILVNYHGSKLHISYYKNEKIYEVESTIVKIDKYERKLVLEERRVVYLNDIVDIKKLD